VPQGLIVISRDPSYFGNSVFFHVFHPSDQFTTMDIRFAPHNLHLESPDQFFSQDPHLKVLSRQPLVWEFPLILGLSVQVPGIYTVSGGRQVGKTTLLKQWMAHHLKTGVHPHAIAFLPES
jgi:hypothetical protein